MRSISSLAVEHIVRFSTGCSNSGSHFFCKSKSKSNYFVAFNSAGLFRGNGQSSSIMCLDSSFHFPSSISGDGFYYSNRSRSQILLFWFDYADYAKRSVMIIAELYQTWRREMRVSAEKNKQKSATWVNANFFGNFKIGIKNERKEIPTQSKTF